MLAGWTEAPPPSSSGRWNERLSIPWSGLVWSLVNVNHMYRTVYAHRDATVYNPFSQEIQNSLINNRPRHISQKCSIRYVTPPPTMMTVHPSIHPLSLLTFSQPMLKKSSFVPGTELWSDHVTKLNRSRWILMKRPVNSSHRFKII